MSTLSQNPGSNPGGSPNIGIPSDYNFGDGYNAGNLILAGSNNKIQESRRCTIINGAGNYILGLCNTHIIGDFVSPTDPDGDDNLVDEPLLSNAFYIGCMNGLHSFGDVVAFSSSDERLKDNIQTIKNPLSKILSLDSVEFDWNSNQETYKGHDIGLIAQQVKKIAPELVTTRTNGYLAIKYDKLTSLLVGAIKEQQDQIKILNDRVEYLLKKLDSMN